MNRFIKFLLGLLGFFFFLVCGPIMWLYVEDVKSDALWRKEYEPIIAWVEAFNKAQGRLPEKRKFKTWERKSWRGSSLIYYNEKPDFISDWQSNATSYVVGMWRGEWFEWYHSWDQKITEY